MAVCFLCVSVIIALTTEPVYMKAVRDNDLIKQPDLFPEMESQENINSSVASASKILRERVITGELGTLESVVKFEEILAEGKISLLFSWLAETQNSFHSNTVASRRCFSNIDDVIKAARMGRPWALKMIDSNGKPASGVLQENDLFVGDFDQCIDVDTGLDFRGQYCTTKILISRQQNSTLSPALQFALGLCFPSSCQAKDVEEYVNVYFQTQEDISVIAMKTTCQERHLSLTTKAKVVICICSIFVTLLVVGTFYDVVYKRWWLEEERDHHIDQNGLPPNGAAELESGKMPLEHEPIIDPKLQKPKLYSNNDIGTAGNDTPSAFHDTCDKFLMSFSIYTNTSKLFTISQSQESIDCIHGMRFISMTWIIMLHVYIMGERTLDNITPFIDKAYDDWTFMPVVASVKGVDTFFVMSGLLLTFLVLKKLTAKKEEVTLSFLLNFYLHRFLRLTPPYMLVLMTYVPLFKYISDGPFWPQNGIEIDECKDTWWTNLLYLSNFVRTSKMCMTWSWYLSNDWQFYLVSPLMFIPMYFYDWKGLIVSFAFLLGSAISAGVITNAKDLVATSGLGLRGFRDHAEQATDSFKYYYMKPYTRIGPFVVGMITGFLLFKSECKAHLSKLVVILGWIAASALALSVVYGPYDNTGFENPQSKDVRALFNALSTTVWGMSVSWVIFACANGYGGFVNTLLSWKVLIPLSRLSYCAYLVHPLVIKFYFFSQRKPFYLNNLNMSYLLVATIALSYAVAYVAYLAYEIPLVGLEKVVRGLRRRK